MSPSYPSPLGEKGKKQKETDYSPHYALGVVSRLFMLSAVRVVG